jgi:hydroxymethylpyrimidine/phosphomethylpyrimidine kinase
MPQDAFILTIAGTDPCGAAGIQADLHVIRDHGFAGASVITAMLAQHTGGVQAIWPMSAAQLTAQLDSALSDLPIAAVKLGLIPTPEAAHAIQAALLRALPADAPVVLDPVLASGDGRRALVAPGTEDALLTLLSSLRERGHPTVITPNAPEAARLTGQPVETLDHALVAAAQLAASCGAALLKAGHLAREGAKVRDVWAEAGQGACALAALPAIDEDVRGTGCHLSSALACQLASGLPAQQAAEAARRYLNTLLTASRWRPGAGRSILRHHTQQEPG